MAWYLKCLSVTGNFLSGGALQLIKLYRRSIKPRGGEPAAPEAAGVDAQQAGGVLQTQR